MRSVQDKIENEIKGKPAGAVFFPQEFRTSGTDTAIKMALPRLAKEGVIERISHGIYTVPKVDPVLGRVPPAIEDIADAIARRDHVQIRPAQAGPLRAGTHEVCLCDRRCAAYHPYREKKHPF